ncbi:hypothetical protein BSLG_005984 [Batrachochytrium salamandrivorans]|nr:hypothetical protein BSLG_005984 [Batrachochytrium salamandrivorans]
MLDKSPSPIFLDFLPTIMLYRYLRSMPTGNLVRGQSQFFSIQNTNFTYHGECRLQGPLGNVTNQPGPRLFHLDLLTSDGLLAARLMESMPPNTGDKLLGAGRP